MYRSWVYSIPLTVIGLICIPVMIYYLFDSWRKGRNYLGERARNNSL